jgi:aminoglycoside phosphotransferase (APT) family kinase protein
VTGLPISDPALPGLAVVADLPTFLPALSAALADGPVGRRQLTVLNITRIRYRPGQRAILSADIEAEGLQAALSLWLHAGTKAAKRASKVDDGACHEPLSNALVYVFPADPHVPALAHFASRPGVYAQALVSRPSSEMGMPALVRYRPGIGATFRWQATTGEAFYVKLTRDGDCSIAVTQLRMLKAAARGTRFDVPAPAGLAQDVNAFAMEEVTGHSFRDRLAAGGVAASIRMTESVLQALRDFRHCGVALAKTRGCDSFVAAAEAAALSIADMNPDLRAPAGLLASHVRQRPPTFLPAPTHGDMKLEHLVLSGAVVSLLDVEDISLSDPAFDFAMLLVRVAMLAAAGECSHAVADSIMRAINAAALANIDDARLAWFKACAALQVAKHHAQSLHPQAARLTRAALALGLRAVAE